MRRYFSHPVRGWEEPYQGARPQQAPVPSFEGVVVSSILSSRKEVRRPITQITEPKRKVSEAHSDIAVPKDIKLAPEGVVSSTHERLVRDGMCPQVTGIFNEDAIDAEITY
ncbi:hypothetical protein AA14337_3208 [Acetobacter malorum DSM 14337]|uniref:Transposase n=1 Tax=Acetobacter malorum DSM 14337 TaxID=1307910 RepID=A0ABQ0Q0B8_9PROT|nr:hypothetical protein AA14337_3208 [Acetobacter malorum DSM 14337]